MDAVITILNEQGRFYVVTQMLGYSQINIICRYLDDRILRAATASSLFMGCGINTENEMWLRFLDK